MPKLVCGVCLGEHFTAECPRRKHTEVAERHVTETTMAVVSRDGVAELEAEVARLTAELAAIKAKAAERQRRRRAR